MANPKVLITGGAGLIGSNLARFLHSTQKCEVVIVDNLSGGSRINIPHRIKLHVIDLVTDVVELNKLFEENSFDVVYHCAAYAAEGLSPFIRKFNYENNLISTANIINACINYKVSRLVYFSSMAVYGDYEAPPFSEDLIPNPIDPYGVAKFACEMDIKIAHRQHGLGYCIIRPHNFYGPGQNINDKYRNVLGIWMKAAMNNLPIQIYGSGLQVRAFSYIGDAMHPLYNAGFSEIAESQTINLGGIEPITLNKAAGIVKQVCNSSSEIIHREPRHEVRYAYSTYQKSIDYLGFKHVTSLETGLRLMYEWARELDEYAFLPYDWDGDYEISDGVYEYWKRPA